MLLEAPTWPNNKYSTYLGHTLGCTLTACRSPWLLQLWRELCRHQSSLHAKATYHMGGISLVKPSTLLSCSCSVHTSQLLQIRQPQSLAKLCTCQSQAWCRRGQPLCCCRHSMNTTGADLHLVSPFTNVKMSKLWPGVQVRAGLASPGAALRQSAGSERRGVPALVRPDSCTLH